MNAVGNADALERQNEFALLNQYERAQPYTVSIHECHQPRARSLTLTIVASLLGRAAALVYEGHARGPFATARTQRASSVGECMPRDSTIQIGG
ncbi:MAG: hypothetical protein WCS94_15700 [Verrucomicrobiota bacterium]